MKRFNFTQVLGYIIFFGVGILVAWFASWVPDEMTAPASAQRIPERVQAPLPLPAENLVQRILDSDLRVVCYVVRSTGSISCVKP